MLVFVRIMYLSSEKGDMLIAANVHVHSLVKEER